MTPGDLTDPTTLALLATETLRRAGIENALYGGLVLAAYGRPRETRDADLAVMATGAIATADALAAAGVSVAVSFEDVRFGGLSLSRVAVLGGEAWLGLNTVDLVRPLSDRLARAVLARRLEAPLRGQLIAIVAPEDFVLLKVLSTRDVDLDDAAAVLTALASRLDLELVQAEVEQQAAELRDVFDPRPRLAEALRRSRHPSP